MDLSREFFACLALRHTPGIGARTWKSILEAYPSAYEAVKDAANWPARGVANVRQSKACAGEEWREDAECEYRDAKHRKLPVLPWHDPDYPARLKAISDPPAYLYYRGDPKLLSAPSIGIVGARDCTRFGLQAADRIARELSRSGVTVVSGMAAGIDRQAHQAALQEIGSTVGVLGTGLDVTYPAANADVKQAMAKNGCVITEFAPATPPEGKNFPLRNRIISGLSLGVLVAEASGKSGSLITARLAAEQGREVFALPGPVGQATFSGCHRLIKQGASLVEGADEILRALQYQFALELEGMDAPEEAEPVEEERSTSSVVGIPRKRTSKVADVADRMDVGADDDVDVGGLVSEASVAKTVKPEVAPVKDARKYRPEKPLPELEGDELLLYEQLMSEDQLHVDELTRRLGWESSRASTALIMLEVKGVLKQLPGMWYTAREA